MKETKEAKETKETKEVKLNSGNSIIVATKIAKKRSVDDNEHTAARVLPLPKPLNSKLSDDEAKTAIESFLKSAKEIASVNTITYVKKDGTTKPVVMGEFTDNGVKCAAAYLPNTWSDVYVALIGFAEVRNRNILGAFLTSRWAKKGTSSTDNEELL